MRVLLALLLLVSASPALARVDYAIDLTAPEHHTGRVSIAFPRTEATHLDVKMPAWRTGRYNILPLANGVRGFTATDAAGRPLAWQKIDRSTWRIQLRGATPVRVGYELYGNELGLRTRHIDDSHAYLNASAVFMYADRYRADDVTVSLKVPSGWNSISGLRSAGKHRFVAPSWDVLTDSPIETGIHKRFRFAQGGRDYDVVFWGGGNVDTQRTLADIRKIVAQAPKVWNGYPFQRYVFIYHLTDGAGGATEHRNSTVIQIPRTMFQPRYLRLMATTAHEFIHTWNVKAYRPAGLVPYDYQKDNYSTLLWLAEGSTSYFADQMLLWAGVSKPKDYFDHLAEVIGEHQDRPGVAVQSVADASFDEWIAPSGDRANNASVDIYTQGEVVSWMLDLALVHQTGGKVSYRDVHDALYRRFPADRQGFSEADVLQILRELTGTSWEAWWNRNVRSPVSVDFNTLLAPVGLKLSYANESAPKAWAGWSGAEAANGVKLTSVARGGPAWNAGFTIEDVIVAVNGQPVTPANLSATLAARRPGDALTVSYIRRGETRQKRLTLGSSKGEPSVTTVANPTVVQKALFVRWLLVPYPAG